LSRQAEYLKRVKEGFFTLDDARFMAKVSIDTIDKMCAEFLEACNPAVNEDVNELLDSVQYNIMRIAIEKEIR
jgi:hypothetical protein